MIVKRLSLAKKWRKTDVFKKTEYRLTLQYTGLIMIFLVLFIAAVYSLLYAFIFKDQERDLLMKVSQEAEAVETYLSRYHLSNLSSLRNQEPSIADPDQFFYYITDSSGNFILGDETIGGLRADLLSYVQGWDPQKNQTRKRKVHIDFSRMDMQGKKGRHGFRNSPENRDRQIMMSGYPISSGMERVGMVYVGIDITIAHQLFQRLVTILAVLALLFTGLALFVSNRMAKKAMAPILLAFNRQREFVADASHELRTPLSVLLSSINAMEMTLEEKEETRSDKLLSNMKAEVKRMNRLVSDLLTLARSDSGLAERFDEVFDFRSFAEKTVETIQPLAASRKVRLTLAAPERLVVRGDSERLTQLLYILLDNAIKYTQEDGEAMLELEDSGNALVIKVRDTGIGIKPEDQARIFERFFRADKARTRKIGGHGLGLSIAKWIAESHGGTIDVASKVGEGSVFTVKIPLLK